MYGSKRGKRTWYMWEQMGEERHRACIVQEKGEGRYDMSVSKGGMDSRGLGRYSVCEHRKLQGRRFT